jgi:hypothetical protein
MREKFDQLEQLISDPRLERERLFGLRKEFELLRADFRTLRDRPGYEFDPNTLHIRYFNQEDE